MNNATVYLAIARILFEAPCRGRKIQDLSPAAQRWINAAWLAGHDADMTRVLFH